MPPATSGVGHLAVVVPVYNEEAGIQRSVSAIGAAVGDLAIPAELIFVDDGSSDASAAALERSGEDAVTAFHVVVHERNLGYPAALRTGALHAAELGCDWVLFMDCDLTNAPSDIVRFVARMADDVDVLKATRYAPGGGVEGVPWRRRIVSRTGTIVAKLLGSPWTDSTNGFRAYRTTAYLALGARDSGFPVIMEEVYLGLRHGLRGAEVPAILTSRAPGQRPSTFGYGLKTIARYAKYALLTARQRLLR